MDLRLSLYDWAAEHRLSLDSWRRLVRIAGLDDEPSRLADHLRRGVAIAAAALGGLGVVFWIAAHWDTLGRAGRFGLLQAAIVVFCLGAARRAGASRALGLAAWLAIGGVLAFFGQTYQTGADPWQLFAWWAALGLPLAFALRSDVLWAPWAVVAQTAVSLWVHAHAGHRWQVEPQDLPVHLLGWSAALLVVGLLAPPLRRFTGAGVWALRTALTLATVMIGMAALWGLFFTHVAAHYAMGLVVLALLAAACATPRGFDVFGLSAAALAINTLLVAGLARALFEHHRGTEVGPLFLVGTVAAGLLAATVSGILRLARHHAPTPREELA
jgi:uncharacterized membrane protein